MHKNIWIDMKADTQTDVTTDVTADVTMDVVLHKKTDIFFVKHFY